MINQNQTLVLRGGIPEDVMPKHVTGGIPIQHFLKNLLDQMPHRPVDPMFDLVSTVIDPDLQNVSADSRNLSNLDDSVVNRNLFVDSMREWMERHVRVKVNIEGVDHSCYVWRSFLDPPRPDNNEAPPAQAAVPVPPDGDLAPADRSSDEEVINPLERNILEGDSSESDSAADADAMFNR